MQIAVARLCALKPGARPLLLQWIWLVGNLWHDGNANGRQDPGKPDTCCRIGLAQWARRRFDSPRLHQLSPSLYREGQIPITGRNVPFILEKSRNRYYCADIRSSYNSRFCPKYTSSFGQFHYLSELCSIIRTNGSPWTISRCPLDHSGSHCRDTSERVDACRFPRSGPKGGNR